MARIDTLANFLTDVAAAIKTKTGKTDSITPANFDTEIASIESGGESTKYAPSYVSFYYCEHEDMSELINGIDIKNTTSLSYTFSTCQNVKSIDLSSWNTGHITQMRSLFGSCYELTNVNVSSFDTTNVTDMTFMFGYSSKLTSLDLSSFYTPNLIKTQNMFTNCTGLKHIDMRNFDFSNITTTNASGMFTSVPSDCEIIVADNTQKGWITSKFTSLKNVKTVAELEAS